MNFRRERIPQLFAQGPWNVCSLLMRNGVGVFTSNIRPVTIFQNKLLCNKGMVIERHTTLEKNTIHILHLTFGKISKMCLASSSFIVISNTIVMLVIHALLC